jgi:CMP-N,N'-diacetyllegionaminic acid synthase
MKDFKILCLIPARSGSKGIPNKNIKLLNGKPLLAYSIEQAQASSYSNNMRIILTTDSEEYAEIGKKYGAEAPFIRPNDISQDLSTDLEFIKHALAWLSINENYNPDIILQLRPTQPHRKISDIDIALNMFIENMEKYDSLRSVVEFEKSPFKMYTIGNNTLVPLFNTVGDIIIEPYNQCRQILPKTYLHNGYIDIVKASIVKHDKISGDRILPYIMNINDTIDIDYEEDWKNAESKY